MKPLRLLAEPFVESGSLDPRIQAELDEGLTIRDECLVFVSQMHNIRQSSVASLGGPTGFEGYINKLPLDWLIGGADGSASWLAFLGTSEWAARCLAQGIMLGRGIAAAAADLGGTPVDVWISVDYGPAEEYPSAAFRLVTYRADDLWAGDLAGFEQPVLRMSSQPGTFR
ncbi:UNVERIFIED_ORG: hypothetical protein J3D58_003031 [Paenarthrobacter nicotinovorans]